MQNPPGRFFLAGRDSGASRIFYLSARCFPPHRRWPAQSHAADNNANSVQVAVHKLFQAVQR